MLLRPRPREEMGKRRLHARDIPTVALHLTVSEPARDGAPCVTTDEAPATISQSSQHPERRRHRPTACNPMGHHRGGIGTHGSGQLGTSG